MRARWYAWLTWKNARRLVVLVIGSTVILVGIALIFLPGPASLVVPAGLAILATEFLWARRLLDQVKARVRALPGIRGRDAPAGSTAGCDEENAGQP